LADIIVAHAAVTRSTRVSSETRRRGPTCRHIEADSSWAARAPS